MMSNSVRAPERRRVLETLFERWFGKSPEGWVRAPGRVELMGTDTDDNEGFVLSAAIDLDTWIAYSRRQDRRIRVYSEYVDGLQVISLDEPGEPAVGEWPRYISGVASVLESVGVRIGGADFVVQSTLPIGAGLSSSAALEVAVAIALLQLSGTSLVAAEIARLCRRAENEQVGVPSGILDQYSSIFGQRARALLIDCRLVSHVAIPIDPRIAIVVVDTGVRRSLAESEYGNRRRECEEGTGKLHEMDRTVRTLHDLSRRRFDELSPALDELHERRCRFIVEEEARVLKMASALSAGEESVISRLCHDSFCGMRDLYEKTVEEMERLWEAMELAPGSIGARQTGGGFGGCLVGYVAVANLDEYTASVGQSYLEATGINPEIHKVAPSEGAGRMFT